MELIYAAYLCYCHVLLRVEFPVFSPPNTYYAVHFDLLSTSPTPPENLRGTRVLWRRRRRLV